MKKLTLASAAALAFSGSVFATDYQQNNCYLEPSCSFASPMTQATVFAPVSGSDTVTFELGSHPWTEYYGTYEYAGSSNVIVNGGKECVVSSGRVPHGTCTIVTIDSASIDGIPLNPPVAGGLNPSYAWSLGRNLAPGKHTFAVTWHAPVGYYFVQWKAEVNGMEFTCVPSPGYNCP